MKIFVTDKQLIETNYFPLIGGFDIIQSNNNEAETRSCCPPLSADLNCHSFEDNEAKQQQQQKKGQDFTRCP